MEIMARGMLMNLLLLLPFHRPIHKRKCLLRRLALVRFEIHFSYSHRLSLDCIISGNLEGLGCALSLELVHQLQLC